MITANGFCCISIFSCAYELGVELTFPIGEATSGGFINTLGNLIGFLVLMSLTPILNMKNENSVLICNCIFAGIIVLAIICLSLAKIDLKRS